jgi:hypothetical protein
MFELALAIVGAITLPIILILIALGLIFFKKIKAGFLYARGLHQSLQLLRSHVGYARPAPLEKVKKPA